MSSVVLLGVAVAVLAASVTGQLLLDWWRSGSEDKVE
jgi:hypothetical protein